MALKTIRVDPSEGTAVFTLLPGDENSFASYGWWLLTASTPDGSVHGAMRSVAGVGPKLDGDSLLVHCGRGVHIALDAPANALRKDMTGAVKALAFHDHVTGRVARTTSVQAPLAVPVPATFGRGLTPAAWLIHGLAFPDSHVEQVSELLRQTEGYRLVRFLLEQEESTNVAELSARYGLSPSHFRRTCRAVLGRALKSELRMLRAVRSLMACSAKGLSFTEVSADFGYASPAHFSTDIRSLFGKSPTELLRPALPGSYRK